MTQNRGEGWDEEDEHEDKIEDLQNGEREREEGESRKEKREI